MKKFLLLLFVFFSFAFFVDSASAEDFYFFRIDSELDVPIAIGTGATARWKCNGTGEGIVTDNTASESTQALDGIVKVASTSVENNASHAGCDGGDSIVGSVSMDGWRYRNFSGTVDSVGSNITFTVRASMDYTILVNGVTNELGNTLTLDGTTASATYSGTVASQSYSGGKKYIAGSTSGGTVKGGADGYVNSVSSALTISSTATQSVDFGTSDNSSLNEGRLSSAYKFTAPSGATVTAGNSFGISCTESSGFYYCAVPVSHTAATAKAVKSGCSDTTITYSLRTSGATAQQSGTFSMCGGGVPTGTLAIIKLIKGGSLGISDFKLFLDGSVAYPGEYIRAAGQHIVSEDATPNYSLSFSNDCDSKGLVSILASSKVTCTLTNTYVGIESSGGTGSLPIPTPIPTLFVNPETVKIYRKVDDPKVYVMGKDGLLYWVRTLEDFNSMGYRWEDVKVISGSEFAQLKISSTSVTTVSLFRKVNDPKVYVQSDDGILRWIRTEAEFISAGYNWTDVKEISGEEFGKMRVGGKLRVVRGIGYLRVRSDSSLGANIIGQILPDEEFQFTNTKNGWYLIKDKGWVFGEYITEI